jgi:hypothetical protein
MGRPAKALFLMIIVHDKAGMNNSGNPAKQGEKNTQEKTGDSAREQHGQGRKNDAEKIA